MEKSGEDLGNLKRTVAHVLQSSHDEARGATFAGVTALACQGGLLLMPRSFRIVSQVCHTCQKGFRNASAYAKIGQQIVLPECEVTIEVLYVGGNQVRLGIAAPADVPVHRSEVWDRIYRQGESRRGGDLDLCLAEWIGRRTSGRIRRLSVKRSATGL